MSNPAHLGIVCYKKLELEESFSIMEKITNNLNLKSMCFFAGIENIHFESFAIKNQIPFLILSKQWIKPYPGINKPCFWMLKSYRPTHIFNVIQDEELHNKLSKFCSDNGIVYIGKRM